MAFLSLLPYIPRGSLPLSPGASPAPLEAAEVKVTPLVWSRGSPSSGLMSTLSLFTTTNTPSTLVHSATAVLSTTHGQALESPQKHPTDNICLLSLLRTILGLSVPEPLDQPGFTRPSPFPSLSSASLLTKGTVR